MTKKITLLFLVLLTVLSPVLSQEMVNEKLKKNLNTCLSHIYKETLLRPGSVTVDSIAMNSRKKTIELYTNLSLSYLPMRENTVSLIYDSIRFYLPQKQKNYRIKVFSDRQEISELVPNFYRRNIPKNKDRILAHRVKTPLITKLSAPEKTFDKGLTNNHIALWPSHGYYYEQKLGRWEWQRARIFQTVEDLYTQSYVVPFLVPMLENAGANVLLPRERDYNTHEIIVDNNGSLPGSLYTETNGKEHWLPADSAGFANSKARYLDGENPFKMGTARKIKTVSRENESLAIWTPDIPEKGTYGVYISYQTVKKSTEDALYSVYHAGGRTDFLVNQQMGGGTWIFLGYFPFDKGSDHKITLSNRSKHTGRIVTADAVKIGGGMGNIARLPHPEGYEKENVKSSENITAKEITLPGIPFTPEVSGYPRYAEGSRYWLQWAGMPDSIYNRSESKNDYTDDYQSRGYWVNYLAGGSSALPKPRGCIFPSIWLLHFTAMPAPFGAILL